MASEYLKWKYRDIKPEEKKELTKEEKRKNWWYYNKWNVIFGIIALFLIIDLFRTMTGMKVKHPDCQIALISEEAVPEETITALEQVFAQYASDFNNDGQILVKVNPYTLYKDADNEDMAYASYASEITLVSDMEECESYFFLMKDPDRFQKSFEILARLDGTLPEVFENADGCALLWKDIPVLANADLGTYTVVFNDEEMTGQNQDLLQDYFLARRGFWRSKTVKHKEECDALWNVITKGE